MDLHNDVGFVLYHSFLYLKRKLAEVNNITKTKTLFICIFFISLEK